MFKCLNINIIFLFDRNNLNDDHETFLGDSRYYGILYYYTMYTYGILQRQYYVLKISISRSTSIAYIETKTADELNYREKYFVNGEIDRVADGSDSPDDGLALQHVRGACAASRCRPIISRPARRRGTPACRYLVDHDRR